MIDQLWAARGIMRDDNDEGTRARERSMRVEIFKREAAERARQEDLDQELMSAIVMNDPESVRRLARAGASLSSLHRRNLSAPALAARADATLALEALLDLGVSARALSGDGREPIHCCCDDGRPEALRALLAAGADPNALDSHGRPALHMAVAYQELECARMLLEAGAQTGLADQFGETPLSAAVKRSDALAAALLLEFEASPLERGGLAESPLEACARRAAAGLDDAGAAELLALFEGWLLERQGGQGAAGFSGRAKAL